MADLRAILNRLKQQQGGQLFDTPDYMQPQMQTAQPASTAVERPLTPEEEEEKRQRELAGQRAFVKAGAPAPIAQGAQAVGKVAVGMGKNLESRINKMMIADEISRRGWMPTEAGIKIYTKQQRESAAQYAAAEGLNLTMWYSGYAPAAISANLRFVAQKAKPLLYKLVDKLTAKQWSDKQIRGYLDKINTPGAVFSEEEKALMPKLEAMSEQQGIPLGKLITKASKEGVKVPAFRGGVPTKPFTWQERTGEFFGAGPIAKKGGEAAVPKEGMIGLLSRIGDIEKGGAYFGVVGQTTYEGGENYTLSPDAKIADLTDVKIADAVIRETLKDSRLIDVDRNRLKEAIGQGDIDYILFDETPMSEAVKRLGYDAAAVRENTDMPGEASSIFVTNLSKIRPAKPTTQQAAKKLTPTETEVIRKPLGSITKTPETGEKPEIEHAYDPKTGEPVEYQSYFMPKTKEYRPLKVGLAGGRAKDVIGGEVGLGNLPATPPEESTAELTFREGMKPTGLATKIGDLYTKIEEVGGIGRITQERTIMNMVEKGQDIAARQAFREGQRAGIFKEHERMEDVLTRRKERSELKQRVSKAREQIFGVDIKHLRPEYQKDIKGLVEDLDNVVKRSAKTLYRLQRMTDYVAEHPDNSIPAEDLAALRRLDKKPIGELSVDEVEAVAKQVQHFAKLNQLKNKLIFGRQLRDMKEVVGEARTNINKKSPQGEFREDLIDVAATEKQTGKLRQIFSTDSYNPEMIANVLDGDAKGGVISKIIYGGIDEGRSVTIALERQARTYMQNTYQQLGLQAGDLEKMSRGVGGKKAEVISVPLPSGKTINMTAGDRMSLLLHASNPTNTSNIVNNGFNFSTNLSRTPFKISMDDFKAIVNSATETEKRIAYSIARYLNTTNKDLINTTSVALNGYEIATVDNYWTLRRNPLHIKQDPSKLRSNFSQATLEGMGILKSRTHAQMPVVIEDALSQFYKLTRQSSSYVGLAKPLRNAKMVLMDKDFRREVTQRFGKHYWDSLDNYLRQMEDNSHKLGNVDKLSTELINKLDLALLGANPAVVLKQFPSFFLAMTEIEPKYILRGLTHGVGGQTKAEIAKWSPQLAERLEGHVTRELGELGQVGGVRHFHTGKSPLSHKVIDPIRMMDTQAIGRIWHAVKTEISATQPQLTGDEYMREVAKRAEYVIRRTQPTWELKDRSAIGRDPGTFVRLLTKYTSQRNKNIQIIRRAWLEYQVSNKTAQDKANLIGKMFMVTLGTSLMIEGINQARDKLMGKKPQPMAFKLLRTFGNTVSYVYFAGDVFNSLISKLERGTYAGYDMSNPLQSMGEIGVNAIAETYQTIKNIIENEEYKGGKKSGEKKWKTSMWRMIDNWSNLAGMRYGIPYATMRNYLRGGYRMITDENEPKHTPTTAEDLIERFHKKKRKW